MNQAGKLLTLVLLMLLSLPGLAALNLYQFDDPTKQQRFENLVNEIRCTVCQNQTIGDSNAELAQDMRDRVYKMIQQGMTDEQIKTFLVDRFTDFVLYRPPVKGSTYLLWLGPFALLIIAFIMLIINIRKRNRLQANDTHNEDHARVAELLNQSTADKENRND